MKIKKITQSERVPHWFASISAAAAAATTITDVIVVFFILLRINIYIID